MIHFCRRKQPEARTSRVPLFTGKTSSFMRWGEHWRAAEVPTSSVLQHPYREDSRYSALLCPDSWLRTINQPPFLGLLSTQASQRVGEWLHRFTGSVAIWLWGTGAVCIAFGILPCHGSYLTMCGPGGDRYHGDFQNHHTLLC